MKEETKEKKLVMPGFGKKIGTINNNTKNTNTTKNHLLSSEWRCATCKFANDA